MTTSAGPALRMVHRYRSPRAGMIQHVAALRRADLTLRFTDYKNVVVDETILTRSFPYVARSTRMMAIVVLTGQLDIGELRVGAGQAALMPISSMSSTKWTHTEHIDLEWTPAPQQACKAPMRLHPAPLQEARAVAAGLLDEGADQRALLERAFALFRSLGAPVQLSVAALEGEPNDRDRRLARAMEDQLTHLTTRATTLHIGDAARLSPRQLQRVVREFNARHGLNAGNWRDTRNRWRLQTAVLLLGCPAISIADVAKEVGYASPHALARAFAKAGFPSPGALRRELTKA